jgi:7-carboxy-7-deazaguanine synthase
VQSAETVATYIQQQYPAFGWVLVTGGEPAQQPLASLVDALHRTGYRCALETSGTALGHVDVAFDWICVSPKFDMPGRKKVLPAAAQPADEIKLVVGRQRDIDRLDEFLLNCSLKERVQVCVQPVSQNPKATQLCIQTAMQRGWRLSVQMHKYLALP